MTPTKLLLWMAAVSLPVIIIDYIKWLWRKQNISDDRERIRALNTQLLDMKIMHNETVREYQKQMKNLQDEFIDLKLKLSKNARKSD